MSLADVYPILQLIHVLAASMWIGPHLVLATGPMVRALRQGDVKPILEFYRAFSWPATIGLLIAVITGLSMAYVRAPPSVWFNFGEPQGRIGEKILTLIVLLLISGYAHARLVPEMRRGGSNVLRKTVLFVIVATLLSLALALLGFMIRFGF